MADRKEDVIEDIIISLDVNFSDSRKILLKLAREALDKRTLGELQDFWVEYS